MKRKILFLLILIIACSACAEEVIYARDLISSICGDYKTASIDDLNNALAIIDDFQREQMIQCAKARAIINVQIHKSGNHFIPNGNEHEGTYVPRFNSFMYLFHREIESIDSDLASIILDSCWDKQKWNEHEEYYLSKEYYGPKIRIEESSGYLSSFSISIYKGLFRSNEEQFKAITIAVAKALDPMASDEYFDSLLDDMHYSYVIDSPAEYINTSYNVGVYEFSLTKSSTSITLYVSLHLPD